MCGLNDIGIRCSRQMRSRFWVIRKLHRLKYIFYINNIKWRDKKSRDIARFKIMFYEDILVEGLTTFIKMSIKFDYIKKMHKLCKFTQIVYMIYVIVNKMLKCETMGF